MTLPRHGETAGSPFAFAFAIVIAHAHALNPHCDDRQKYLFPALQPPSATALAEAQAALEAKYDEASGILASLQDETSAIRETLQSQEESVRESTRAVDSAVKKLGEREEERDRQIGEIKTEMDAIKGLMERVGPLCSALLCLVLSAQSSAVRYRTAS